MEAPNQSPQLPLPEQQPQHGLLAWTHPSRFSGLPDASSVPLGVSLPLLCLSFFLLDIEIALSLLHLLSDYLVTTTSSRYNRPAPQHCPFLSSHLRCQRPHSYHPNPVCQDISANGRAQMVPTPLPPSLYLPLSFLLFTKILQRSRPRHHGKASKVGPEKQLSGSLLAIPNVSISLLPHQHTCFSFRPLGVLGS